MVKILIVEDDPLMSRMYRKIFTGENYQVEVAENGEDGIAKAKTFMPDIILLDIMMPKMDGLTALGIMKQDPNLMKIPVVMLTNLSDTGNAEEAISKGAVKYIIKSEYDPKQVIEMVNQVLGQPAPNPS